MRMQSAADGAIEWGRGIHCLTKVRLPMRNPAEYRLSVPAAPDAAVAEKVFELAWRFDFTAPGFALLDHGPGVDSHTLRTWMVDLKGQLSEECLRRTGKRFLYRSLARFDQQET